MNVRRFGKFCGRLLLFGLLLWAATFAVVAVLSLRLSGAQPLPERADAIICLGAGMSRYGSHNLDTASQRRALTCAALHHQDVAPRVVFTGYGHRFMSAAEAMADTAIEAGLPHHAAIAEIEAQSTLQNAAFSLEMLPPETSRIVVVSDAFHLPRAWVIFRAFGVQDVSVYPAAPLPEEPASDRPRDGRSWLDWTTREASAIWANAARGAAYVGGGWIGIDHDTRIGWFN